MSYRVLIYDDVHEQVGEGRLIRRVTAFDLGEQNEGAEVAEMMRRQWESKQQ